MNLQPTKPTTTTTTTTRIICSNCGANNRWVLHHVQLRSIERRLCTSCVLRLHPSSFCPFCFQFYDNPLSSTSSASAHRFLSCIKCSSLAHVHCLPSPAPLPSSFICPPCSQPSFCFFGIDNSESNSVKNNERAIDKKQALVLLCASKIASASMNKAAILARAKAERSVREAAFSMKRAREALEHVLLLEKARRIEGSVEVSGSGNSGAKVKKEKDKIHKTCGLGLLCSKEEPDGFSGQSNVPAGSPKNSLPVAVQDGAKENGNGTMNEKSKSGNSCKLEDHDGSLESPQISQGRVEENVSSK